MSVFEIEISINLKFLNILQTFLLEMCMAIAVILAHIPYFISRYEKLLLPCITAIKNMSS